MVAATLQVLGGRKYVTGEVGWATEISVKVLSISGSGATSPFSNFRMHCGSNALVGRRTEIVRSWCSGSALSDNYNDVKSTEDYLRVTCLPVKVRLLADEVARK